jgi:hypothetical protein
MSQFTVRAALFPVSFQPKRLSDTPDKQPAELDSLLF